MNEFQDRSSTHQSGWNSSSYINISHILFQDWEYSHNCVGAWTEIREMIRDDTHKALKAFGLEKLKQDLLENEVVRRRVDDAWPRKVTEGTLTRHTYNSVGNQIGITKPFCCLLASQELSGGDAFALYARGLPQK